MAELSRASRSGEIRASLLDAMRQWRDPISSKELASLINVTMDCVNPRLSELVSCGLAVKTGDHRMGFLFTIAELE
jgi:hypothetical protein